MQLSGFIEGDWPCVYLGMPLYVGRTLNMFDPLLAKVQKKLADWKSKLLSFGGKLILMKHVRSSMPIHLSSVMDLPKGIFAKLKSIFSNFHWGSSAEKKKRKWVSWRCICLLTDEGGLGIQDLAEVRKSLFLKFVWNLILGGSLWSDFFKKNTLGMVRLQHLKFQ